MLTLFAAARIITSWPYLWTVRVHTYIYVYMYVIILYNYECVLIHIYIHTYIYIYIHIYIYCILFKCTTIMEFGRWFRWPISRIAMYFHPTYKYISWFHNRLLYGTDQAQTAVMYGTTKPRFGPPGKSTGRSRQFRGRRSLSVRKLLGLGSRASLGFGGLGFKVSGEIESLEPSHVPCIMLGFRINYNPKTLKPKTRNPRPLT